MMRLGQLKTIVDSLHELYGPEMRTHFHYQKASGRIGVGDISTYKVLPDENLPSVAFTINYARGKEEE